MAWEQIVVVAGGRAFEGWTDVSIQSGMIQAVVTAIIRVSEVPDPDQAGQAEAYFAKWHFPPFTSVQIFSSGNLVLTGYVDEYRPSQSPTEHSVTLLCRGNQMNIVDSSAYHPTGEWANVAPDVIVRDLASRVGVGVKVSGSLGAPVNIFRLRKGSTIYAEAIRLLQPRMATISGDVEGGITIAGPGVPFGTHAGAVRQGVEIEEQTAKLSAGTRFASYYVYQQNALGVDPTEDIETEGTAEDPGVPLPRNKVIIQTMPGNSIDAQRRAVYEAQRAFGYSCEADITVRGWRDDAGAIWHAGYLVFVYAPSLKIDQQMLIETVELNQSNGRGTTATLHVVNPLAHNIQSGASGSNQMWTQGPPIAEDPPPEGEMLNVYQYPRYGESPILGGDDDKYLELF